MSGRGTRRIGLSPESLASSLLVVLLVNIVQRSVGLGRSLLFGRWLEPVELGHWEMAFGFLIFAAPMAVLGLPGSFSRYLEKYRQQGRLGLFLTRTAWWTFGLAGVTIGLMLWRSDWVATLVFGDAAQQTLAEIVVGMLIVVIAHHFMEAVFAGLRMFRVVSAMYFAQSLLFAAISLSLIACWRAEAVSVVVGYGGACLVSLVGVAIWSLVRIERLPDTGARQPHQEFWPPLMRFAIWVWVTNLLTNTFSIIDRYMIVHFGGFTNDEALTQVGNYHTSQMVPVLLVSLANLVVGAMTPHLSHDWECGRRDLVSSRLNLGIKLTGLAMLVGGVAVLIVCPPLFEHVFQGKYSAGLAVLPWTVAACVWFSLLLVAQTYVWCAEQSRRAAGPLVLGIVCNVTLNLLLLPPLGLQGALIATGLATLLAFLAQLRVNRRLGMGVQPGVWLIGLTPLLLVAGVVPALIGSLTVLIAAVAGGRFFTPDEREMLAESIRSRLPNRRSAAGAAS